MLAICGLAVLARAWLQRLVSLLEQCWCIRGSEARITVLKLSRRVPFINLQGKAYSTKRRLSKIRGSNQRFELEVQTKRFKNGSNYPLVYEEAQESQGQDYRILKVLMPSIYQILAVRSVISLFKSQPLMKLVISIQLLGMLHTVCFFISQTNLV